MTNVQGTSENRPATTVTVRATGNVRERLGNHQLEFTFEGRTLGAFLNAFFNQYDVSDLLIAESETEAVAPGWAPTPDRLDDAWYKNDEGEQTKTYARVCVNGRFNEILDGFETVIQEGDRITLAHPFIFCC
ncbi:MAG: molybdopterin converting factor small subunit [Halobacteriales archaeon]|jgi:molybdopterin converting factor small subunit